MASTCVRPPGRKSPKFPAPSPSHGRQGALAAAFGASVLATVLWQAALLPGVAVLALLGFGARALLYAVWPARTVRARTLGCAELVLGIGYLATLAATWPH